MRIFREAVRRSPDHLAAVAHGLVVKKDVEGLHLFVRDQIRTLPDDDDGFSGPVKAMRWGARATLRYGAGTPREKAELLARSSIARRGSRPSVVVGRVALPDSDPLVLLRGPARAAFAPSLRARRGGRARRRAGWGGPFAAGDAARPGRSGRRRSRRTARRRRRGCPTARRRSQVAQVDRAAAGARDDARRRSACQSQPPRGRAQPPAAHRQAVGRSCAFADAIRAHRHPHVPRLGACGAGRARSAPSGAADELGGAPGGRRVRAAGPGGAAALDARRRRASGRADAGAARCRRARRRPSPVQTRTGRAVTLGGDVIDVGSDGAVRIDDEPVADAEGDAAIVARVASLEVTARSVTFPSVSLAVTARDAAGAVVDGLPASAFVRCRTVRPSRHCSRAIAAHPGPAAARRIAKSARRLSRPGRGRASRAHRRATAGETTRRFGCGCAPWEKALPPNRGSPTRRRSKRRPAATCRNVRVEALADDVARHAPPPIPPWWCSSPTARRPTSRARTYMTRIVAWVHRRW